MGGGPERKKLFEVKAGEGAVSIKCERCGMEGTQRITYISYLPTWEGRMVGFSMEPEMIRGNISWKGDHSHCGVGGNS